MVPGLGMKSQKRGVFVGILLFGIVALMVGWLIWKKPGTVPAATPSGVAHSAESTGR